MSRVTVREAVKMVAGKGLLDLARGRRAVVKAPDASALGEFMTYIVQSDPKGVFDLVEIRMSLEVQAAGLAAQRATGPALAAIEHTLKDMRAAQGLPAGGENEQAFHEADVAFHQAIAMASGNRILTSLFEAMAPALSSSFFLSRNGRQMRGQTAEHTVHAHQRVLDCIVAGDVAGAEAAMRVHLMDAAGDMRAAIDGDRWAG